MNNMQVDSGDKASLQPCSLSQLLVYFAKLGVVPVGAWPACRPTRDLSGLDEVRSAGGNARRPRLHPAFPNDGARARRVVPPIRMSALDARCFLWRRSGGNRHHSQKRLEAGEKYARI